MTVPAILLWSTRLTQGLRRRGREGSDADLFCAIGFALYDCHWDRAYRYSLSEEALLALFAKTASPQLHLQALHLALAHGTDASLAGRVRPVSPGRRGQSV